MCITHSHTYTQSHTLTHTHTPHHQAAEVQEALQDHLQQQQAASDAQHQEFQQQVKTYQAQAAYWQSIAQAAQDQHAQQHAATQHALQRLDNAGQLSQHHVVLIDTMLHAIHGNLEHLVTHLQHAGTTAEARLDAAEECIQRVYDSLHVEVAGRYAWLVRQQRYKAALGELRDHYEKQCADKDAQHAILVRQQASLQDHQDALASAQAEVAKVHAQLQACVEQAAKQAAQQEQECAQECAQLRAHVEEATRQAAEKAEEAAQQYKEDMVAAAADAQARCVVVCFFSCRGCGRHHVGKYTQACTHTTQHGCTCSGTCGM